MKLERMYRKLTYKDYLICYLNKKEQICTTKVYARNQVHAVMRFKQRMRYDFTIVSITKLSKKLGEIL